jgi:Cupin-like domain
MLAELHDIDRAVFERDILPGGKPAILRGLVRDWTVSKAAAVSHRALGDYLKAMDEGRAVGTLIAPPAVQGRYFYNDTLSGFNFERHDIAYTAIIDRLLAIADKPAPMSIYAGSADARGVLPRFAGENPMPLLGDEVPPRLWLGNRSRIAAHYDVSHNIACVVAGRRRFTLFPPDQIANLYIGPLEFTMAGQPASMVDFAAPDLVKYPKFADAMAVAHIVDLEPGDALYMPALWWHHVEAEGPFNLLVNYWWQGAGDGPGFESMILGLLGLRDREPAERAAWKAFFDHYVFGEGAASVADHLPPNRRGVLGPPGISRTAKILEFVKVRLSQR